MAETIRTLRRQRPPPPPLRSPPYRKNAVKARLRALSLAEPAPNERDIVQIATTKRRATRRERKRERGNPSETAGSGRRGKEINAREYTAYKHSRCSRSKGRFSLSRLIVPVPLKFPTTLAALFGYVRCFPFLSFPGAASAFARFALSFRFFLHRNGFPLL